MFTTILLIVILYLLVSPPRYDPAIRLKYWLKGEKYD